MKRILQVFLGLIVAAVISACVFVRHVVDMPGKSFEGPAPAADARLESVIAAHRQTVDMLSVTIGERNVSNQPAALAKTAEWLKGELTQLGYTVDSQEWQEKGVTVENLSIERRGTKRPDEIIVVGAHYDSAPGTPGADDNASGVASLLWLAREWKEKAGERTVRFIFFTNEEPPWFNARNTGSQHAAARSVERHEKITGMLSLETMGYALTERDSQHSPWPLSAVSPDVGHFIAFIGRDTWRAHIEQCVKAFRVHGQVPSEGVAAPNMVKGIDWSDHGPYSRAGFPSLMVTDTALYRNPNYHEPTDLPPTMDFAFLARVSLGLDEVVTQLATP